MNLQNKSKEELIKIIEELTLENQKLKSIPIDNIPNGVIYQYISDLNGSIISFPYSSSGVIDLFGFTPEELKADPFLAFNIVHPEDLAPMIETSKIALKNLSDFEFEYRIKSNDTYKWVLTKSKPRLIDNNLVIWDGITTDITAYKQLEVKLQESETKYRLLFENMSLCFSYHKVIFNEITSEYDFIYLEANKACREFNGFLTDEFKNKSIRQLFPKASNEMINKYCTVGITGESLQFEYFSKLYNKHISLLCYSPSKGYFATVFEDITERKNIEEQLVLAKEKAEDINKLKSTILSNMSHELRTPMNSILGFSHLLPNIKNYEEVTEISHLINSSALRLMETLNLIIDLSKIEAGELKLVFSDYDLIHQIKEQIVNFNESYDCKNIEILFKSNFTELIINNDSYTIGCILTNLISNAIKFTNYGCVVISVKTEIISNKENVVIKIADTGIGIDNSHLDTIFEEFRQASEGLDRKYDGSGLGLTLVKKCANLIGGNVEVKSKLGEGSAFTVKFPLKRIIS